MGFFKKFPAIFTGIGITIVFMGIWLFRMDFLDTLELKFYDLRMHLRSESRTTNEIILVDIDNDSIEKLGRWPWQRSLLARGITKINAAGPKVIGLNIILSEPEVSDGLLAFEQLKEVFRNQVMPRAGDSGAIFLQALDKAQANLDHDKRLAEAIKRSGNVVLPVFLRESAVVAENIRVNNELLLKQSIQHIRSPAGTTYPRSDDITLPIAPFFENAKGIGHINLSYDPDGTVRRERPLFEYHGAFIPSYTITLAALYLNVPNAKIRADLGSAIYIGSLKIPTTLNSDILIGFKGSARSFKRYSFYDVINDKVPANVFKNRLVLVSPSAPGIMNPLSTPTAATMTVGEFSANALWSILNKKSIRQPDWNFMAELLMILFIGLAITLLIPRLKAVTAGIVFVSLVVALIGGSTYLFASQGLWVKITYPLIQLILGYIGVITINYFVSESSKEKIEGESAETNRMLGLSFQSQGMLDMAWDKFRRIPVDDDVKDILYNLALDYERKRQINKAAVVYEYIEEHDKSFKDVAEKKDRLIQASETIVFGDGSLGGSPPDEDLLATATGTRPTLGRYEIVKRLGKGAMGIVYLGNDPRINRTTAIKTYRFGDDIDPDEVKKLKVKFFREAESAGTLSHPHIVTIFDAGDEQDLAFIAMEYLEGETLEKYTKKDNLLPVIKVISYMAAIADGLDYAHKKGIVHRDIKPANIMLLKSGVVKITDFGVARITATSQTQTGVVKGTPYYMSPEQFSGAKVDGRSDIFSLGTMMYQLLTGELPFKGNNPAALMHHIMHVPHANPKTINPKILTPLVTVIDRALEKDRNKRYQKAGIIRDHLREIHKKINEVLSRSRSADT